MSPAGSSMVVGLAAGLLAAAPAWSQPPAAPAAPAAPRVAAPGVGVTASTPRVEVEGLAMRLVSLLRNAPEVNHALADLGGRQADQRSARLARFPRLNVQGELGSLSTELVGDGRSQVDSRVVVGTRYTLYDFGRTSARIAAAERGVAAGEHLVRQATENVALDALTTYLQVLRFTLLRDVGRDSERALRSIEQLESRRVELGGAGITDARLASSRLAVSGNRLMQFEASLEEARARFAVLFGYLPVAERLPAMRVPPAWLQQDVRALLAAALASNPELLAARQALEQARQALEAERAGRWPAVDLSWSRRYEFPGGFTEKPQLGVVLSTNSSNMLEAQARVGRAAAKVMQEEERVRQLERDIGQAVQTAVQRHALGRNRETLLRTAAGDSAAVFQGRQRLNAAGRETTLALLDAQVEANNVLIDWVNAIFDQRLAELRLAKESGRLVPATGEDLDWARSLFAADDFRTPVREHLAFAAAAAAARGTASAAGAAARSTTAASPRAAPNSSGSSSAGSSSAGSSSAGSSSAGSTSAGSTSATPVNLGALGAAWSLRIGLARVQR